MHRDPIDSESPDGEIADDSQTVRDYLSVTHAIGNYLLTTLDSVCRSEGIPYFIYAGTLLGAVRSGGWIPWDDDVDVAMFRDDFERFRRSCAAHLPDDVMYSDYLCDTSHVDTIPRLLFLPSERQSFGRKYKVTPPNMRHVGLDIFILDEVPSRRLINKLWLASVRVSEKLIVARSTSLKEAMKHPGNHPLKRAAEASAVLLSSIVTRQSVRRLHHRLVTRWATGENRRRVAGCNHFEKRLRSLPFTRGDFFPPRDVEFAGLRLPGPADADKILTDSYGDYMTPPPLSARVPMHLRNGLKATIADRSWTFGPRDQ